MIIITNESNPATLKLLICAAYGKKNVDFKIISSLDAASKGIKHLPLFVFESQKQLFLSNTAARYLFVPPSNYENQTNEWLEWESTLLKPTAVQTLTSAKPDPNMLSTLNTLLKKLNNVTSKFLIGDDVTVCDIAIWTTLYPIYADNALKQKYLASFNNVDIWMSKIEQCLEVKEAFAKYKLTPGLVSLQALLIGDSYMNQSVKENKSDENQKETKVEVNQSSPVRQIELVTADELNSAKQAWLSGAKALPKPKQYSNPVLPISGEKNVLITSALPYVNNVPHLGNIIGCVLSADVFARYCRLCNYNTIFICGTDEYGTATETKALEEGLTPQQICDKYFEIHNTVYRWFGIGFDYFGRTTTPEQTELVQDIFLELNKNGFMETQPVEQLLCQNCDRYLADRFVEGTCPYPECGYEDARGDQCDGCGRLINATELIKPQCKLCRNTPVAKTSYQFFLDLPKLEPILYHWIKKTSSGWSNNAHVIAKSWLREGLKARCITRDLKWGIPVPLDKYRDKVFYVWFDAPIGYMSITKRYTQEWEKWWKPSEDTQVTLYQFMAKDNVPFHTVMFPAVLFGTNRGYTTVNHVMATEYLNYEDGKFSKSRGVGVFGTDALETGIPSDVWRFYLLYMRPESQDSSFNWVDLGTKNNSELLNNLGNFINRGLTFTEKFFNSVIPEMHPAEDDYNLLALCTRELKSYIATLEKAKLRDGIKYILNISRHGNQYVQSTQPWVLIKGSDEDKIRAGTIVGICCNIVCLLATLLQPYMPETSRIIQNQLNSPPSTLILSPEKPEIVQLLPAGHKIGKPVPLFSKIEPERIEELRAKYAGKQQGNANSSLSVSELEAAIAKQGEKVRALKQSSGKEVWAPEVAVLLDLKKKLAAASGSSSPSPKKSKKGTSVPVKNSGDNSTAVNSVQNGVSPDDPEVKSLESEIEKQGNLVRNLKTGGAPKTEWQPQVNILLDLKNKLASLTGIPLTTGKKSKK